MNTITEDTDRDALLRYLDLTNAISDLVNDHLDLPLGTIASALNMKADEVLAVAYLPKKFRAPAKDD